MDRLVGDCHWQRLQASDLARLDWYHKTIHLKTCCCCLSVCLYLCPCISFLSFSCGFSNSFLLSAEPRSWCMDRQTGGPFCLPIAASEFRQTSELGTLHLWVVARLCGARWDHGNYGSIRKWEIDSAWHTSRYIEIDPSHVSEDPDLQDFCNGCLRNI